MCGNALQIAIFQRRALCSPNCKMVKITIDFGVTLHWNLERNSFTKQNFTTSFYDVR